MTVIDNYIKKLDPKHQPEFERLRGIVLETVPGAEETISYGMPAFKYKGKAFIGFALFKNHIGVFPFGMETINILRDKLQDYELAKSGVHVPFDKPLPEKLLKEIITTRIQLMTQK